jgi:hypothetical protein
MADETRITGSSLASFGEAARAAFGPVLGDPAREGYKAAEVVRMWMTGGGFVGVPQFHVELAVLHRADQTVEPAGTPPDGRASTPWICRDWFAYHDFMPASPPTLHVGARCTTPANGYRFELTREPPGYNERDLLLRLIAHEPDVANEVVTEYVVHYSEETDFRYDTVSIRPGGPSQIPVQILEAVRS